MSTSQYTSSLLNYLTAKKISYELVDSTAILNNNYVRAVLFKDQEGYLLAILSANCILDVINVGRDLGRELKVVEAAKSPYLKFYDQDSASYCPIPDLLNTPSVIDQHLAETPLNERVFISYGEKQQYLALAAADFKALTVNAWQADLAIKLPGKEADIGLKRMHARINETVELPLMPPIVNQLLKLKTSNSAEISQLSKLVEQDPSLTAQLISWACSPYYGYKGKITSVDDAIINVLGFDLVINIALGIAISQKIRIPLTGPLGLKEYWRKAIYTSALVEKIIYAMPKEYRAYRGMAYLCGLLHNFGRLLIGQMFPAQFEMLTQIVYANSSISVLELERYLLKVDELQIAQWLMQSWSMPLEVQIAVSFHNQLDYIGEHSMYVDLIVVANLLQQYGSDAVPLDKIQALRLEASDLDKILENFKQHRSDLDHLVNLLAGN